MRKITLGAVAMKMRGALPDSLVGMSHVLEQETAIVRGWLEPDEAISGSGGHFDVCDLRIWLELARIAGIEAVPAKTVLSITENELEELLPKIRIPEQARSLTGPRAEAVIREAAEKVPQELVKLLGLSGPKADEDRLHDINDSLHLVEEIPDSWMVRTSLCGSSNLKALVGTGVMLKGDDTAQLTPDVELGAGWVRVGNRRMIDFSDRRFIEMQARGHKPEIHYMARPWVSPARFHDGEDLHRANSPLAGPGRWPSEWRVFVKNGQVTGVANYYGWTGDGATAENAWNAIEAAARGQDIADAGMSLGLSSQFMDTIRARSVGARHEQLAEQFAEIDPNGFHAALDFIETVDGLLFLEGGPGHLPGGGGHPCAFAGQGISNRADYPQAADCIGVAFKVMPHVHLGEPSTWTDADPEGSIVGWEAAMCLAAQHAPLSDRALQFLERVAPTGLCSPAI